MEGGSCHLPSPLTLPPCFVLPHPQPLIKPGRHPSACLLRSWGVFTKVINEALPQTSPQQQASVGPWIYRNYAEAVLFQTGP